MTSRLGPLRFTSGIRALSEIAAHAFAQQFNVVAWYPLVLDELERRISLPGPEPFNVTSHTEKGWSR